MNAAEHVEQWVLDFIRLEPHIENALEYSGGTHSVRDVIKGIKEGQYQFWPGEDSVVITEIVDHPQARHCYYFLAGGNLVELEEMAEEIEAWAKKQGCTRIGLTGRKGWSRTFLRDKGYEPMWHVMGKEL